MRPVKIEHFIKLPPCVKLTWATNLLLNSDKTQVQKNECGHLCCSEEFLVRSCPLIHILNRYLGPLFKSCIWSQRLEQYTTYVVAYVLCFATIISLFYRFLKFTMVHQALDWNSVPNKTCSCGRKWYNQLHTHQGSLCTSCLGSCSFVHIQKPFSVHYKLTKSLLLILDGCSTFIKREQYTASQIYSDTTPLCN